MDSSLIVISAFGTWRPGDVDAGHRYDVFGVGDRLLLVDGDYVINGAWRGIRPDEDTFITCDRHATPGVSLPRLGKIRPRSGEDYNDVLGRFREEGPDPEPAHCVCCRQMICRLPPKEMSP